MIFLYFSLFIFSANFNLKKKRFANYEINYKKKKKIHKPFFFLMVLIFLNYTLFSELSKLKIRSRSTNETKLIF